MADKAGKSDHDIDQTITKNLGQLSKYGVLTVRPGYEIAGHQLTGKRAIVATVHTKKAPTDLAAGGALPDNLGGVPVDVRQASGYQRLRAADPLAAEVSQAHSRPEDAEPEWPLERELPSGQLLKSANSETQKKLRAQSKAQPIAARALAAPKAKPQIQYDPQGCPPLTTVPVTATVTVMASPDAGLKALTGFLNGMTSSLVVGMYDFTSAEILGDFTSNLKAPRTLQMVLDDPAPNPTRDQIDWVTVQDLKQALDTRANIAWALTRSDHFAAKWLFPYAYHIKVIVRDGNAFWLSSGNLNRSNEPNPDDPPSTEDRDWHVIIEHEGLAKTFTAYLDYDYKTATANQAPNQPEIEKAIEDAHAKRARASDPVPPQTLKAPAGAARSAGAPVAAKAFDNLQLEVTPMLTPDRVSPGSQQGQYLSNIMKLIQGAQDSISIELQYMEASGGDGSPYDLLLQALQTRIKDGKDVRIIVSANYAEKWGEKMKAQGVDLTANIRTMPNVHNKGFVVDSDLVVVSSQNFSPAGVSENRDAGVVLKSKEIAGYFAPIFNADWGRSLPLVAKGGQGAANAKGPASKAAKKPAKKAPAKASKKTAKKAAKKASKKTTKKTSKKTSKKAVKKAVKKAPKKRAPKKKTPKKSRKGAKS
jgi:phosphatidylserine/phosphatidylglycerophosphate/cardiolipin synthase-like enzyme